MRDKLIASWKRPNLLTRFLLPFSRIYGLSTSLRRELYERLIFDSYRSSLLTIVVGNLTVGGSGKTPLVISLVNLLRHNGFSPAVVSRGYGGKSDAYPLVVTPDTPITESGDEPALILEKTSVPVIVSPKRSLAVRWLEENSNVDVIVCDDGLQHLALQRDIEICLLDHSVEQENTYLLPAGPYRESIDRLTSVDIVVHHYAWDAETEPDRYSENRFSLEPLEAVRLSNELNDDRLDHESLVHAVAAIGKPQRFFNSCRKLGYKIIEHEFSDHHFFEPEDLQFGDDYSILMTEKDAVKCRSFGLKNTWVLPVEAKMSSVLEDEIQNLVLQRLQEKKEAIATL